MADMPDDDVILALHRVRHVLLRRRRLDRMNELDAPLLAAIDAEINRREMREEAELRARRSEDDTKEVPV